MEQFEEETVTNLVWYNEGPNYDRWVVFPERIISEWDGEKYIRYEKPVVLPFVDLAKYVFAPSLPKIELYFN
jgi:hypothetical protein